MKIFKAKKIRRKKKRKIKLFIFVFFFFFSYIFIMNFLKDNKLKNKILNEDVNYIDFNIEKEVNNVIEESINNPVSLLNGNVKNAKEESTKTDVDKTKVNSKQTKNVINNETIDKSPIAYIYNTHQTEGYADYTVYDAAKLLYDKLNSNKIYSYFEEQSMKVFLDENGLKYYNSYTASRTYLDSAKQKYTTLKYFFDIHRDSVSKEVSTISYNGKDYAKVLFVVGTDNPTNASNKETSNKLNEIIKSKVPNISRGIVYHGGKGFNGVYNQDVSSEVFLIEVGGKDNTKEEVENTINVIYESIVEYIRGAI